MRPESLRLLQQALRVNPSAKLAAIAKEHPDRKDALVEALVDVYAHTAGYPGSVNNWDLILRELDHDPRTLVEYMSGPGVCALIRAQEVPSANT